MCIMEYRDELLEIVENYMNNQNTNERPFRNLFSTYNREHNDRRTTHAERLQRTLLETIIQYNSNISRYQDNMESLINIFQRLVSQNGLEQRQQRQQTPQTPQTPRRQQRQQRVYRQQTPPTFYYSWAPSVSQNMFENVIVSPTQEEIEGSTTTIVYNPENPPINTTCPITLDNFVEGENVITIRHCGHTFRASAFNNWFRTNVRCPVCRYDIREYRGSQEPPTVDGSMNGIEGTTNTGTQNITNLLQRFITDSLATTMREEINGGNSNDNATFLFDFNFPSSRIDPSGVPI